LKIERLEGTQFVSEVPFFGRQAKGEKGKVLGLHRLSFAWRNDSTYFVRIASNHQVARFGEKRKAGQPRNEL
jgi:hypothetical protein